MSELLSKRRASRGFTLIELLLVITIILLISGMFLGLSTGDGGGLPAGQRMVGSSIRSVRAMALMNRGTAGSGISYNSRYRLLILNDPTDPVNHLRQFCIAVGGVLIPSGDLTDPASVTATNDLLYAWVSPEGTSMLPAGVYFIPPKTDTSTTINPPAGAAMATNTRRSIIGSIADNTGNPQDSAGSSPPTMRYAPLNQPTSLQKMATLGAKNWYYIEIQPSGASNHLGRVMIVLAKGSMMPDGAGVALNLASASQFAALALRPNGDVSFTSDPDEMDKANLTK
jgi:prepilin-type N-terminal cleavage/methylation domain-containing protein